MGTELFNGCFGKSFTQNDVERIISCANKIDTAECYKVDEIVIGSKNITQLEENNSVINRL